MNPQIQWHPSLEKLPFSPIRHMFNKASSMKDVLHLSIGQPDFAGPPHIIEAMIQALRDGKTRYELDAGLPELREAIAKFYSERNNIQLTAENVLVTTGCCQAMFISLTGAVQPGKEVIVIEPLFVLGHLIEMAGAKPVRLTTTAENGYQIDPEEVIAAMNDNTCAVMLNSPGNPTGVLYPKETIRRICEVAAARNIAVISDEVYDRLVLDDVQYASALNSAPTLDNVIMCSSASKTWSLAGLRMGWAISSAENIRTMQRLHMYISTNENTPTQWAIKAAFEGPQDCVDEMVAAYRARRDRCIEWLDGSDVLTSYSPGGAFFIMPSFPKTGDSFDLAMRLLDETNVCVIPGGAFGDSCNNAVRISFATSMDVIDQAFERMVPWFDQQSF